MIPNNAAIWLAQGETGLSSKAMFTIFTGVNAMGRWGSPESNYPHDPDDFKRCELLLRAVPEFRSQMYIIRALGGPWEALADNWGKIVDLLNKEIPGIFKNDHAHGRAPETYELMKSIGC